MIKFSKIVISATYDTGHFMHFSIVNANPKSFCDSQNNIQSAYNLNDKDFLALELIIGNEVNKYIMENK